MSADRELLELAAKAAGLTIYGWTDLIGPLVECIGVWNPLDDDGDALRLAVKLRIDIGLEVHEISFCGNFQSAVFVREESGSDPYAATRRAIVRAAAEIGRAA